MPHSQRVAALDSGAHLSVVRQSHLLGVSRSRHYYHPAAESELNLRLLRLMDEHYLDYPDKGPRRMLRWLRREHQLEINLKRINRLYYKVLGLQSLLPGPHTSRPAPGHKVYPYLLRGLSIERPNQVWQTDISYIPMKRGYLYLTAWIDVYSRFVLDWSLSNTMTAEWCSQVYQRAVDRWGYPEIVNTDQGAQYTSEAFTQAVLGSTNEATQLSMDGRGRATDNAFIERLWRTVKYEYIYLHEFVDGLALKQGLRVFFDYYNYARDHSSLSPGLPHQHYPTGPKTLS
ncbi:IS3 family transposase [Neolewinella sp.]|uniref:IS3 family transposase n=1 Tax=Neolewinella sp. TaxID=2993543 RepID=UPI003B51CE03